MKRIAIAIELGQPVPWHHECYKGILDYAREQNWSCVVDPFLIGFSGRADGCCYDGVVGRISKEVEVTARGLGIPVVNHWRSSPVADEVPTVTYDTLAGVSMAAEHLIGNGYRRLASVHINFAEEGGEIQASTFSRQGRAELMQVADRHGLQAPEHLDVPMRFEASRREFISMRGTLSQWLMSMQLPVGILVESSSIARYLAQVCNEVGLRVPHDVAIIVEFAIHMIDADASPTLSSISHDLIRVGYESAAVLDRLMQGLPVGVSQPLIPPKGIVVRESSNAFVSSDPLVRGAMRFISQHCQQPLRVADIASALNVSRRTLERRFAEVLNRSVYAIISRFRIEHLKRELIQSDRSLSEIAYDYHFSDPSHFSRYFRKEVGLNPGEFRNLNSTSVVKD